jgi:hypothetical protein
MYNYKAVDYGLSKKIAAAERRKRQRQNMEEV